MNSNFICPFSKKKLRCFCEETQHNLNHGSRWIHVNWKYFRDLMNVELFRWPGMRSQVFYFLQWKENDCEKSLDVVRLLLIRFDWTWNYFNKELFLVQMPTKDDHILMWLLIHLHKTQHQLAKFIPEVNCKPLRTISINQNHQGNSIVLDDKFN